MGTTREAGITLKQMAENVGLEEDDYLSLLELFITTSTAYVKELQAAIHNGDSKSVFETTHTIRGAAENLCIPEISGIAKELEMRARQNILEGAEEAAECLMKEITYLTRIIHQENQYPN
jgi:HPt (histidine-containing phosphotransfer) domain-containing protein